MELQAVKIKYLPCFYYRPHPKDEKGNSFTLSVHTRGRGYLPWLAGYLLWPGGYLPWMGVPILDGRGYVPWMRGCLPWPVGTYFGHVVPTWAGGHQPWMGDTYLSWRVPTLDELVPILSRGGYLPWMWGYPPRLGRHREYLVGSMPLVFTQED